MPADRPMPWNRGRCVGPRLALGADEAQRIDARLAAEGALHDRCLFRLAIDSMLRCSDLLGLRVGDLCHPSGEVRPCFTVRQHKTRRAVHPVLTPQTRQLCQAWIEHSGKGRQDALFTRGKGADATPISPSHYRVLIKGWVGALGLNEGDFSSHSLRRTKPIFLYQQGVPIEEIALLLGHKDIRTTTYYLGLTVAQAQRQALRFDLFEWRDTGRPTGGETMDLDERALRRLAEQLARFLSKGHDPPA